MLATINFRIFCLLVCCLKSYKTIILPVVLYEHSVSLLQEITPKNSDSRYISFSWLINNISYLMYRYCTVSVVLDHFWHQMYNVGSQMTPIVLVRFTEHTTELVTLVLFATLLVVITIFFTLSSGPPISYLGAVLWCLLLPKAGS
jgi:hypothetical protein